MVNKLGNINLKPNVADFCLIGANVAAVLRQMPEHDRFLRGMIQWVGFKQVFIEYDAHKRYKGKSKYSFSKLFSMGMSGITSFSAFPLRLSLWVGSVVCMSIIVYALYIVIDYYFITTNVAPGWSSLVVLICFFVGLQLIMIGVVGEYVFRLFNEVKGRPLYIVSKEIGFFDERANSKYGIDDQS